MSFESDCTLAEHSSEPQITPEYHPNPQHSPTDSIPNEVLSQILLSCSVNKEGIFPTRDHPHVLLALVSRRWRDVAYSTPGLWTRVILGSLSPPFPQASDIKFKQESVLAWISRAGDLPLDISIGFANGPIDSANLDDMKRDISSVTQRVRKMWTLSCSINSQLAGNFVGDLFGKTNKTLDLRGLVMEVKATATSANDPLVHLDFSESPKLEYVWVSGDVQVVIRDDSALHSLRELDLNIPMGGVDHLRHIHLIPSLQRYAAYFAPTFLGLFLNPTNLPIVGNITHPQLTIFIREPGVFQKLLE